MLDVWNVSDSNSLFISGIVDSLKIFHIWKKKKYRFINKNKHTRILSNNLQNKVKENWLTVIVLVYELLLNVSSVHNCGNKYWWKLQLKV